MIKPLILTLMVLGIVTGCTTTKTEIVTVTKTLTIPERYLDCKELSKSEYPEVLTLKDKDVAKLILKMDKRIAKCAADDRAILELQKKSQK